MPSAALASTAAGSVVEIKTCAGGMKLAVDGLVDDLEDGNNRVAELAGRGGYWSDANDDKGSGLVTQADPEPVPGLGLRWRRARVC